MLSIDMKIKTQNGMIMKVIVTYHNRIKPYRPNPVLNP